MADITRPQEAPGYSELRDFICSPGCSRQERVELHRQILAALLLNAFEWKESPEGFDYWNEVDDRLRKGAGYEETR